MEAVVRAVWEGCVSKIAVRIVAEESVAREQIGSDAISKRAEVARNDRAENLVIWSGWVEKWDAPRTPGWYRRQRWIRIVVGKEIGRAHV